MDQVVLCSRPEISYADMDQLEACYGTAVGGMCKVICLHSFVKNGTNPICKQDGNWGPLPRCSNNNSLLKFCIAQYCTDKPVVKNGDEESLDKCAHTELHNECDFDCLEGYYKKGKDPSCFYEGVWIVDTKCVKITSEIAPVWVWVLIATGGLTMLVLFILSFVHCVKERKKKNSEEDEKVPEVDDDMYENPF